MKNKLISLVLIAAALLSLSACGSIKRNHGHQNITPEIPDEDKNTEQEQAAKTKYVYSVLSKSIHLEGCHHINEIKEEYKKETTEDITPLLEENEYTLCRDCFPPAVEPEPDEPTEPQIPKDQATFLINNNSKKIHKLDCYHIEEMSESNIKYTDLTLEELLEKEHIPCATCLPDQWAQYKEDHPELFPEKE